MSKKRSVSLIIVISLVLALVVMPRLTFSVDLEGIDAQLIGADEDGTVYGNLNLPPKDAEGRDIVWSTEDESLIDIGTGKIKKYMVNGILPTAVTATVEGLGSEEIPLNIGYINSNSAQTPSFLEDFNDEELNGGPRTNNNGDIVYPDATYKDDHYMEIADGKLHLHRSKVIADDGGAVVETEQQWNFGDTAYTQGKSKVLIEFDVTASEGADIAYYLLTSNKTNSWQVRVRLHEEATILYYYDAAAGKDKYVIKDAIDLSDGAHFKFLVDYTNTSYSFWVDDELLCKDFKFRAEGATHALYTISSKDEGRNGAFDLYLDDLTISDVEEPLSDITLSVINNTDTNVVRQNLYLPAETIYGEPIVWTSENGNITVSDEEGIVAIDDTDKEDILTASITTDEITYSKKFELSIPKYEKTYSSAPVPVKDGNGKEKVAYEENFDNTTMEKISGVYLNSDDAQRAQIADGKLVITTDANAHHRYSIADAVGTITDRLVVEFDVIRENTAGFECWISGNANAQASATVLTKFTSGIHIATSDNTKYHTVSEDYSKILRPSKIAIMYCLDGTFSLWVDGERVVNKAKARNRAAYMTAITRVNFRSCNNMGSIKIDNLRVYEAAVSEVEMAEKILENAADSQAIAVRDESGELTHFAYSGENEFGCNVTFSSENSLVNEDGSINYPLTDTTEIITMTVTSPDGYAISKDYTIEIPANYILGEIEHDVNSLGLMLGNNEFVIPAKSRGTEPEGGISVCVKVYDGEEPFDEKTYDGQYLKYSEGETGCFVGAIKLAELPENPKVRISVYGSESQTPITQNFEITQGG